MHSHAASTPESPASALVSGAASIPESVLESTSTLASLTRPPRSGKSEHPVESASTDQVRRAIIEDYHLAVRSLFVMAYLE